MRFNQSLPAGRIISRPRSISVTAFSIAAAFSVCRGANAQTSTPISCDVPISACISTATEVDGYTFNVTAGEVVSINVGNVAPSGPSFSAVWRLLTAGGATAVSCGGFGSGLRDCGPLPTSGNPYRIEVTDGGNNDIGCYQIHLQRDTASPTCEPGTIRCDGVVIGSIHSPI